MTEEKATVNITIHGGNNMITVNVTHVTQNIYYASPVSTDARRTTDEARVLNQILFTSMMDCIKQRYVIDFSDVVIKYRML